MDHPAKTRMNGLRRQGLLPQVLTPGLVTGLAMLVVGTGAFAQAAEPNAAARAKGPVSARVDAPVKSLVTVRVVVTRPAQQQGRGLLQAA